MALKWLMWDGGHPLSTAVRAQALALHADQICSDPKRKAVGDHVLEDLPVLCFSLEVAMPTNAHLASVCSSNDLVPVVLVDPHSYPCCHGILALSRFLLEKGDPG